ncbi:Uncharacterised protein [Streptococcus pyogenes]|uniref:hypothetical protein n=1 Tax=Streptococcus pyogenes TaxID=1314 RepID=UPI0010D67FDB|nr:hypothetical protein [Streptococcus pyogenes]VHD46317.1 Uncharacterised protein [Streptococcus pyogenes]
MKTKSKRFVNLATLCLALLGTTLLMEQSAEAEVILIPRYDWSSRGSKSQAKEDSPHQRGRVDGHKAGLEAAKRNGDPTISPDAVPKLYGSDEENRSYRSGYVDMYRHGYLEGRHALEGNEGRENAGRENAGRENAGRENEGRENEGTASSDLTVEETDDFSVIDEVVDVIYHAVSAIWSYLRGWF